MRDKLTNTSLYFKNDESKRIEVKKNQTREGVVNQTGFFTKGKCNLKNKQKYSLTKNGKLNEDS